VVEERRLENGFYEEKVTVSSCNVVIEYQHRHWHFDYYMYSKVTSVEDQERLSEVGLVEVTWHQVEAFFERLEVVRVQAYLEVLEFCEMMLKEVYLLKMCAFREPEVSITLF
jgi:hypothetical protein